jgi:hypothetical protein
MADEAPKCICIPPEQAVFWLDGQGRWHNQGGPFRKKAIIDHFNAAIARDDRGYYVGQQRGAVEERVYFPYEDTALFVVDLIWDDPARLLLNTGGQAAMVAEDLFIRQDGLYAQLGDEVAKFAERALIKLCDRISGGRRCILTTPGGRQIPIREVE